MNTNPIMQQHKMKPCVGIPVCNGALADVRSEPAAAEQALMRSCCKANVGAQLFQ